MKAVVITRFGGPEVLEIQDVPPPQPGPDEVLVRVRSSAINRADLLQRLGRYAAPAGVPENIPGLEFAGEIVELGANAGRWDKGDRVMGIIGGGAHAEFVTAHQDALAAVPPNLEWSNAGAIPEVFITAHDALQQAGFKAGENVLIHAVGSGVGLAATQLVNALGGRAFGTSRTPDKIERAKPHGLTEGYVVPEPSLLTGLSAFAKNVTGGRGFDVVLDLNGGPYFAASLEAMALRGRMILIGGVAGGKADVELYHILGKRLHVIGTVLRARSLDEKIAVTTTFAREVVPLLANGSIQPVVDSVFPLDQIQDAHRRLESNATFGKVALTVSEQLQPQVSGRVAPACYFKLSLMQTDDPSLSVLSLAQRHAFSFLNNLDHAPAGATADVQTLRQQLSKPLDDSGLPPEQVITELVADVAGGLLGSAGGRFYGWVIGGAVPAALAADWLTATWDQNAALYATSPAAAVVEEVTGLWLKDILRLPQHASFALVSGCQMAHATCLAAARHALLAKRGWDVEQRGLYNAPPIRILTSKQRHGSFERAVRLLGLGRDRITCLTSDTDDRLEPAALQQALETNPSAPTIVLLQAGDINIGAFDDFETLIPIAKRYGAWVHVDGAFGLWAAASPRYRHLVKGVEAADSWATDGHKWLNVPFDCGYAFIAHADAHRASLSHRAPYLVHQADARDEMDWNPEWSRRSRGFSSYAAIRELGRDGIAALIDRCCRHAHALVMGIGSLAGAEVLWEPIINQGLVRFLDPSSEQDHDRRTDEVIAAIVASGEAFFGGTTWRGKRAMRVSVCNWRTSAEDVRRSIDAAARVLGVEASHSP